MKLLLSYISCTTYNLSYYYFSFARCWELMFLTRWILWQNRSRVRDRLEVYADYDDNNMPCNIHAEQHFWFLIHKDWKLLKRGGAAQSRKPQLAQALRYNAFLSFLWQVETVLVIFSSISCISLFSLICWNMRYPHSAHEVKRTSVIGTGFFSVAVVVIRAIEVIVGTPILFQR